MMMRAAVFGEGPFSPRAAAIPAANRVCPIFRANLDLSLVERSVPPPSGEPAMMLRRPLAVSLCTACLAAVLATSSGTARGQFGGGGGNFGFQAVGGISIDPDGIIRTMDAGAVDALARERKAAIAAAALPAKAGEMRKVSLARLVAAVADRAAKKESLPADLLLLGGLERITHVFVDPDGHDVILAGPADRPVVDAAGNFVAAGSGRPLLLLEDLIVALRAIDQARAGGIQCSIDPTPEGLERLQKFLAAQRSIGPAPEAVFRGMEEALGPQKVRVGGVPADSRFARVLVAADYRLKRIGMGLEPSGVKELPSYLTMVPAGGKATSLPRFWLEAEYDPIARDADELAWRLSGRRMKCLTETDLAGKDGMRRGAGAADAAAQKWCAAMTQHYDAVAAKQAVFAELLNCVDLAVVAALIKGRQLDGRAGLDLGPLVDAAKLPLPRYDAPTTVPTVASGLKKGTNWVLSASGGIQFQPWAFAANATAVAGVGETRAAAVSGRPQGGQVAWD
jgi:hypothetical protein